MHKFTILLFVVLVIAIVAADPIRKNKKVKAAKLVRAHGKSAKLVRPHKGAHRSGKLHHFESDFSEHEYSHEEPQTFEDEVYEVVEEILEDEVPVVREVDVVEVLEKAAPEGAHYFNTHFGKAENGVIAVGNSYSTGANGKAQSTATSHGQAQAHHTAEVYHHETESY